ncbi:hypothetical protein [Endozoicomonas lisbonensis]|uniref:hypothetical protein n=1 Tax=Endozoicomonas lisbonensis TaxID=3120522 RepID=UPI0033959DD5
MSKNIFGDGFKLATKTVSFGGGSVVVSEFTDHDYHQYVSRYLVKQRKLDDEREDELTTEEELDRNRDIGFRLLAVSLMAGTNRSFDDLYEELTTPGKYSQKAIEALKRAMDEVNQIEGNSTPTTTSE